MRKYELHKIRESKGTRSTLPPDRDGSTCVRGDGQGKAVRDRQGRDERREAPYNGCLNYKELFMSEHKPQYLSPASHPEGQEALSRDEYGELVIDVGAGNLAYTENLLEQVGEDTQILATEFPIGGDWPPSYLDSSQVHYVEGNGAEFINPGSADTLYAVNVIQDTEDPESFLEGLEQARSSDGVIVLSFSDKTNMRPWPDDSIQYDEDVGFHKFSVSKKDGGRKEQYFIPSEWLESKADDMGLSVLEKGRVPISVEAMDEIEQKADDPTELPNMDEIPEHVTPSVRYYVLGEN